VSPQAASLVEGYLTLPTYDGEPGRHAAAQMHDILARSLQRGAMNYVRGGWNQLVERIAGRASGLGVDLPPEPNTQTFSQQLLRDYLVLE
jgi:hypothetical protein